MMRMGPYAQTFLVKASSECSCEVIIITYYEEDHLPFFKRPVSSAIVVVCAGNNVLNFRKGAPILVSSSQTLKTTLIHSLKLCFPTNQNTINLE